MTKTRSTLAVAAAALAAIVALASGGSGSAAAKPQKNIVGTAAAAGQFTTLVSLAKQAGLAGALSGPGPLTVFAPTDAAFVSTFRALLGNATLTESDVIAFINAGGVDTALGDGALANILLFHVTNGRRTSNSVIHAPQYRMLNGERLTRAQLLDAGIVATDISASNGVIHVIGSVLLP